MNDKTDYPLLPPKTDALWIILNYLKKDRKDRPKTAFCSEDLLYAAREQLQRVEGYLEGLCDSICLLTKKGAGKNESSNY